MAQQAFFFDESRCIDCRACSIACRDWNGVEDPQTKLLRIHSWEEGVFPDVEMRVSFAPCFHCGKPLCLESCPQHAIVKDPQTGAVLVDEDACTGCGACASACPYGSPQISGRKTLKCTMCYDRLVRGDKPACVNACPMRALDFGPAEEIFDKYGTDRTFPGFPSPEETSPSIAFKKPEAKKPLVAYDANRARTLFAQRGECLPPLYASADDIGEVEEGLFSRRNLGEVPLKERAFEQSRNDEW